MKTIEEKAKEYAFETFCGNAAMLLELPWPDFLDTYAAAYLVGATEALAGQWRKSDDTEGLQDGERVIVVIQRIDDSIKYFYAAYYHNGKFWDDSDDSEIYFCNLWMRLPEPPKDESE